MSRLDRGLLIAGEVAAASGDRADVVDPGTGVVVGSTAVARAADVDAAVRAARAAFPSWRSAAPSERAAVLHRAAELIEERVEDIARTLTLEQGKPVPDSRKEILFGAQVLHYYAEEGRRVHGSLRSSDRADIRSVVDYHPFGVVAAVVPWNYPVDLYCWKIAPALAAGNTVVAKPPLEAPLAAGMVAQCLWDAGLPEGVLSDVPGAVEAGEALSEHPDVALLTATASVRTGQAIMRSAAGTLKRLVLELGGQSPFVVLDDADVEEAAAAAARRSFSNAGQICIAVNRILVADRIADDFVAALVDRTRAMTVGYGLDPSAVVGPVTTDAVRSTAERHVADAVAAGGRVVAGGAALRGAAFDRGRYFAPTVLDRVPSGALVMSEETFGPVVGVHRFGPDVDPAALANGTRYGLAAYVFGRDLDRAWGVAERIDAGGVGVNVNDVTELQAPFGGWNASGFGRELGPEGLHGFLQPKHVRIRRAS